VPSWFVSFFFFSLPSCACHSLAIFVSVSNRVGVPTRLFSLFTTSRLHFICGFSILHRSFRGAVYGGGGKR
jgi:hypothetical protein